MINIKIVKDKSNETRCAHCGHEISPRHKDLGYCSKCFKSIDKKDRTIRFNRI